MRTLALSMEFDLAKYHNLHSDQVNSDVKEDEQIDSVVHNIEDLINENK
jgi:hypothetical protein